MDAGVERVLHLAAPRCLIATRHQGAGNEMHIADRTIRALLATAKWLALPVALLLFVQWPLRDYAQAWSRETNDFGQWLFALFVACSVVAATRSDEHIATDVVASRLPPRIRKGLLRIGIVFGLLPWALFVAWAAAPQIAQSVRLQERFPDTANPAYFMVKVALGLFTILVVVQAVLDLLRGGATRDETRR
jgi:TRAP-type mannitol/chloroaromatic compound transport system permease small subunit